MTIDGRLKSPLVRSKVDIKNVRDRKTIEPVGILPLRIMRGSQWCNLLFSTGKGSVGRECIKLRARIVMITLISSTLKEI